MTTTTAQLEADIAAARSRLPAIGFTLISDRLSVPNVQEMFFARGPLRVRVLEEEATLFLQLGPEGREGFDPDVWESCLDGRPPSLEVLAFQTHLSTLERRAAEFESAFVRGRRALEPCLGEVGLWRLMRRSELGLVEQGPPDVEADLLALAQLSEHVQTRLGELSGQGHDVSTIEQEPDIFRAYQELIRFQERHVVPTEPRDTDPVS